MALRYQADRSAKAAKFGYTRRSTRPRASSRELSGNSSNKIMTSGGCRSPAGAGARPAAGGALAGRTSWEVGETSRNSSANTSGAGAR